MVMPAYLTDSPSKETANTFKDMRRLNSLSTLILRIPPHMQCEDPSARGDRGCFTKGLKEGRERVKEEWEYE